MPTVEDFEAKVYKVEGIRIRLRYPNGRDVRGDKVGVPAYDVETPTPDSFTVRDFKDSLRNFVGFNVEVDILDSQGDLVHGKTSLAKLRSEVE